jgi:hypothetical protein
MHNQKIERSVFCGPGQNDMQTWFFLQRDTGLTSAVDHFEARHAQHSGHNILETHSGESYQDGF